MRVVRHNTFLRSKALQRLLMPPPRCPRRRINSHKQAEPICSRAWSESRMRLWGRKSQTQCDWHEVAASAMEHAHATLTLAAIVEPELPPILTGTSERQWCCAKTVSRDALRI